MSDKNVYDKPTVLSLQLRQSLTLRRITRQEFFSRLQLLQVVDPIVDEAYRISEEKILREQLDDDPHGHLWHVSFHGSQFPGSEMSCPRQMLYRMMDFPPSSPMSRLLRQTAHQGKEFEADLVRAWHMAGMLLSSADPENQTGFQLPEAWLTSSVDAVILPPRWKKPLPIEIKQRKSEILQEMRLGKRGPFPEHVNQIKVQIAFVRMYQENGWWLSDLDPVTHGYIYYGSRDNPLDTAEFRVDYDPDYFSAGVERLKRYRTYFEEDMLPELNPGKRSTIFGHPHGWRWSKEPCQFCSFKKTCQLDFREGRSQLSDSIGVDLAQKVRPDYDAESARLRVRARWAKKKSE
jgi:CRISPR/Cas system-associated exonuclease Cas4 (RecB family)